MRKSAFPEGGRFYKGNLHAHTTLSDGRMNPAALRDLYRDHGYDFLAITDHRVYGVHEDLQLPDFLILPGVELDVHFAPKCHHIVAIGKPAYAHGYEFPSPPYAGHVTVQRMIDELNAAGQLTIYCHPRWSHVMLSDFATLTGIWGVEVMNWGCEVEDHTGDSEGYLEQLWWLGKRWYAVGTDDTHQRQPDYCGAYVMVKARELTLPAICEALKNGNFYASTGPSIEELYIEDDTLRVVCSPCRRIHMVAFPRHGTSLSADGAELTEAIFELPKAPQYVRIQCIDEHGRSAWSQPFFFD